MCIRDRCTRIIGVWDFASNSTGELIALPGPTKWFRGKEGRKGENSGNEEGKTGIGDE